ncbi:MAG TPA: hypothetical protein VNI34_06695 [Candidatus Nitrosotalea sp.]|nr:hypothetical protein [Candidatus Nitrosotalea sp.]
MPASILLGPAAVLLAGAALIPLGRRHARLLAGAAAWASLAVVVLIWRQGGQVPLQYSATPGLGASPLGLDLDAVSLLFSVALLVPAALLLTFQERTVHEGQIALMALAAAQVAISASSMFLAAVGLGAAAVLLCVGLRTTQPRAMRLFWASQVTAGTLLLLASASTEASAGTSVWSAIPAGGLSPGAFALLAGAGLLSCGLLPWRWWPTRAWHGPSMAAGTLAVAVVMPVGLSLLARAYSAGAGTWPSAWFNLALGALGTAVALAAGLRAQAASDRRGCLAEMVPLQGGLALAALALGTPIGLAAAATAVLATQALAGILPLIPESRSRVVFWGLAIGAGVPPGLVFGARLLSLEAAFGSGPLPALFALLGMAAWLLAIAALVRSVRLPGSRRSRRSPGSIPGVLLGVGASLVAGVGLGAAESALAIPAAAALVRFPPGTLSGGLAGVTTASGSWPSLELAPPMLVLLVVALMLARPALPPPDEPELPAFIAASAHLPQIPARMRRRPNLGGVLSLRTLGAAATSSNSWYWLVVMAVLALVVTR